MFTIKYFKADFCWPCKIYTPLFQLAVEKNTDSNLAFEMFVLEQTGTDIFTKYKITTVPTTILEKDWEIVDRKIWILSEETLLEWHKSFS